MPIEMYQFIKDCVPHSLTVGDIKKLKVGDVIDVVIWDPNFEENHIWDNCESNKEYDAKEFFQDSHCKLTIKNNLEWDILYSWGENTIHPIHVKISINGKERWKEITPNGISSECKCELCNKNHELQKHHTALVTWENLSDDTHVGWRGYSMLWDKLDQMPLVYYIPFKK